MVKQLDIFGNEVEIEMADPPQPKGRPKRATMNEMFGSLDGQTCSNCEYLVWNRHNNRTYFKCEKWVMSSCASTDKRLKDIACKLYKRNKV